MVLDKRQKILLISFIVIILITIGLFYWNYKGETVTTSIESSKQPNQVDFSIFKDPAFKELDNQSQAEIDIGQIGRDNPFEPQ